MVREIRPVCDFIFSSIHMSLLTDTVDMELMTRGVKGIYTYRKDHMAKSTVFSPWSRTVNPLPLLHRKIKPSKVRLGRQWCGIITKPHLTFLPLLSPNIILGSMPQVRPGLDGLTEGIGLTL